MALSFGFKGKEFMENCCVPRIIRLWIEFKGGGIGLNLGTDPPPYPTCKAEVLKVTPSKFSQHAQVPYHI